jgi:hypothetical protein
VASLTTTRTVAGVQNISAVYSGQATTFLGSGSSVMAEDWVDFTLTPILTAPGVPTATINPGAAASYSFSVSPLGGGFNLPVTLSAAGLPQGASVTFTPNTIAAGTMPGNFTMTIQTAEFAANPKWIGLPGRGFADGTIALGLLLLPFIRKPRKTSRIMSPSLFAVLLMGLAAIAGLSGCGTSSAFENQQTYAITVTGTATGASGLVLLHSTPVTLTVE